MDQKQILHNMCQKALSNVDIKVICKNRGFSSKIAGSVNLLEGSFLSPTGLAQAMEGLKSEEIILLHLMRLLSKPVDISFFDRIYGSGLGDNIWLGTFNQRFKDVFKQVKARLIRSGLLIFAEENIGWEKKTKLESTVFIFPQEFYPFLPSPLKTSYPFSDGGENKGSILRDTLINDLEAGAPDSNNKKDQRLFSIQDGCLLFKQSPFTLYTLKKWQFVNWQRTLYGQGRQNKNIYSVSYIEAVNYVLSFLGSKNWIHPDQLKPVFSIFCHGEKDIDTETVCREGWNNGCLARQSSKGQNYYRSVEIETYPDDKNNSGQYLINETKQGIKVDLQKIPFPDLEFLTLVSWFDLESGQLKARPDLVKIGREAATIWDHNLFKWLLGITKLLKRPRQQSKNVGDN